MSSPQRRVVVTPYDPGWSLAYRTEEEVLVEARSLAEVDLLTGETQAMGCVAKGEQGVPGGRRFR
jgi:hypothetical protein